MGGKTQIKTKLCCKANPTNQCAGGGGGVSTDEAVWDIELMEPQRNRIDQSNTGRGGKDERHWHAIPEEIKI